MLESLEVIKSSLPYLLQGGLLTVGIVLGAMFLGLFIGLAIAVGLVYGSPRLQPLLRFYVWLFRGLPILVLLFLFYFGLFNYLGLNLSAFISVILILGMVTGAYQAVIFRGAMLSLRAGPVQGGQRAGNERQPGDRHHYPAAGAAYFDPGLVERILHRAQGLGPWPS